MREALREKLKEAVKSVMPLTLFVLVVNFILVVTENKGMPDDIFLRFLIGAAFLLLGMTLVEVGAEMSMIPMGDSMGSYLTRTKKYLLLVICCFLIGAFVTMAEPDIALLATQFPGIDDLKMILIAAGGVGLLLVFGVMRVIRRVPLPLTLAVFYTIIFVLSLFEPGNFFAVAFDSGGTAMGPIVVPYIMAIGIGLASVRGGRSSVDDSFGLVGICSLGPVIAMLLFGIFGHYDLSGVEGLEAHSLHGHGPFFDFLFALPEFMIEVAIALVPIAVFFIIFQAIFLRLKRHSLAKIGIGLIYTFIGHMLFLCGINVGFLPAGTYLGSTIAALPGIWSYAVIPAAMLMGMFVVPAEPVVALLNKRVEAQTVGAVSKRAMTTMLSIGAAVSMCIAMLRILTGLSLHYVLFAGYALSLALSLFVPKIFTAIAFDSGGAVSGAMALSFLLPFAKGACMALTGSVESVLNDAFGIIALITMTPVLLIQIMGLVYTVKLKRSAAFARSLDETVTIIEFDREEA